MTNKTNYMRSVNDYSLSSHEIFNSYTEKRFPPDTRVYTVKNVRTADFPEAVKIVVDSFTTDGFKLEENYFINYNDGTEEGEESQYTIYEQRFYVLSKSNSAVGGSPDLCVLEVYRRNNELIILTLATFLTDTVLNAAATKLKTKYKAIKKDKVFYTISASSHGFELEEMKIPTVYDESHVDLHYNDEFRPVHESIHNAIDTDRKGLFLLHGIPGSGKTSYIKQLISKGGARKLVYIPPHLASSIASPQFISFVREKLKGSVLVIEDAEDILRDRQGNSDSTAVSNLLNISDGILGEALNILIIATFNVEKEFIDSALMRKGRMIAEYYFGELDVKKAEALVKTLYGSDAVLSLGPGEKRTLANIFNMDEVQHRSEEAPKVVFGFQGKGK